MDIGDILENLSEEDMENLRQTAAQLFEGATSEGEAEQSGMPDLGSLPCNAELLEKIGTVMNAMNRRDPRSELIAALKPLLTEKRRKKADEAAQIIKLMDIMPLLGKAGGAK